MSTALVPVRQQSFAQRLSTHYREVRARLGIPDSLPSLPPIRRDLILSETWVSPDVMDRLAQPSLLLKPPRNGDAATLLLPAPEVHTVFDIVPQRFGHLPERMRPLSAEAHRAAARRSIAAYLAAIAEDPRGRRLQMLKRAVVTSFKVDPVVMTSPNRRKPLQQARQFAMCMARMLTTASLSEVGNAFGGRDHTTVHHAFRKYRPMVLDLLAEMYDGASCEVSSWR